LRDETMDQSVEPAALPGRPPPDGVPAETPRRRPSRAVRVGIALAVVIVATAVGARVVVDGIAGLNPFRDGFLQQRTVDRSGPAVLKAVTDLGTLQSAGGYYEIVIDVERSIDHVPSFLAGRRVLFVAAGTVDAGVDLKELAPGAVTVDDARTTATLRLPKPQLGQPRLDLDRSYVYSEDRGIVDRIGDAFQGSTQEQKALYTLAAQRLAQAAAANDDLTGRAEANARGVLQGLLRSLGFTDVTVTFES
jgi:hypothetical protein